MFACWSPKKLAQPADSIRDLFIPETDRKWSKTKILIVSIFLDQDWCDRIKRVFCRKPHLHETG